MDNAFDRIRRAMRGQENSQFEIPSIGRFLSYMNPAGNLSVVFCFGDNRYVLVFPDGKIEACTGKDSPLHLSDNDLEETITLLESVEPVEFYP